MNPRNEARTTRIACIAASPVRPYPPCSGSYCESRDANEQRYAVRRLESALNIFGEGFHIYQYLFKANWPEIPFTTYDDDVVNASVGQRCQFFEEKHDCLYRAEIFYAIVPRGQRSKTGIMAALKQLRTDSQGSSAKSQHSSPATR